MTTTTDKHQFDFDILNFWLAKGLCSGSGDGERDVCIEEAVALCAGLPKTDHPDSCIDPCVSAFGRRLNDRDWSSPAARSKGLRDFAFAQLGTAGRLDKKVFAKRVAELVIREIVPLAFRAVARLPRLAAHKEALDAAALDCETKGTAESARKARQIAYAAYAYAAADAYAADAAADAYAYAYAAADADAAAAAYAYAYAYADADADADDAAAAAAAAYDAYAAYDVDANVAAAAYADDARSKYRDKMLGRIAAIGVRAIKEQLGDEMIVPVGSAP